MHGVGRILLSVSHTYIHAYVPCFPTAVDGVGAVDIVGRPVRILAAVVD